MLMSAMVKVDVHSLRNRFLWEMLGNAQYLTSSQGHCVIPWKISLWSKWRSQLSQRVNLERAQRREMQMSKARVNSTYETQMKEAVEISTRRQGFSKLQYLFYQWWQPNSTFRHWWEKQRKKYETRWELDDFWGSHVYKFSCRGKRWRRGRAGIVTVKKNRFIGISWLAIQ